MWPDCSSPSRLPAPRMSKTCEASWKPAPGVSSDCSTFNRRSACAVIFCCAGNLLGEEQSGHIKEVGFELYQQMLEEAVLSLKAGISAPVADRWSPQITIGTALLIPEDYVGDLSVRLALYRRLAEIEDERDIDR